MKQSMLFLFLILPLITFAQTPDGLLNDYNPFNLPVDSITGKISFTKIIEEEGKNKAVIYANIKNWITGNYKSPKDVINIDDSESGIILLKSFFQSTQTIHTDDVTLTMKFNYYYSLKVNIKDSKYKITITDIEQQPLLSGYSSDKEPFENALLINKSSKDYISHHERRKEMADILKGKMNGMIVSIEHYNTDF